MNQIPFEIDLVTVTPNFAKELLKNNLNNYRPLDNTHVYRISEMMSNNQFRENGDPVRISKTGIILDGQHRLHAIIKSGTTHRLVIYKNCDETKMDASLFDTGKRRVGATHLAAKGIKNSKDVWAASKNCMIIKRGQWSAANPPLHLITDASVFEFVDENIDTITSAVSLAIKAKKIIPVGILAAILWSGCKNHDVEKSIKAQTFVFQLKDGANLEFNNPVFCLRKFVLEKTKDENLSNFIRRALATVTWNNFVKDKQVRRLNVKDCPAEILVAKE